MATSLSSLSDEQLQVYKDLLSKKQGTSVPEKPKPPESNLSKVGNFLKGKVYDPTLGSIGQGARDVYGELTDPVNKSGGIIKGAHEMISGGENTLLPVAAAAAITNPEVTLPAMALGAAGQAAGKYIPKMFGASEDVSNLTGDIAGLAAGGLGAKEGPRISSAAKVAAPDVAAGLGKAGVGMATGAAMHGLGVPGSEFSTALMTRPGLKQAGQGLVAGARELLGKGVKASDLKVEPPSKVTPPKGPSIGELKTAVKNGILTPEQFDAHVDQMNLTSGAKELHKADVRVPNKADASIGPVESPKTLNIGQLERLVKIGRLDPEEFNARLVGELKYKPEDAEHLTELLKKQIEDESKEEKEAAKPEKKVEQKSPKVQPPSGGEAKVNKELNSPISDEELQRRIDKNKIGEAQAPLNINKTINNRDTLYHFTDSKSLKGILDSGEINDRQGKSVNWNVSTTRIPEPLKLKGLSSDVMLELDKTKVPPTSPRTEYNTKQVDQGGNYPNPNFEAESQVKGRRSIPSDAIKRVITTDPNKIEELNKISGNLPVEYIPKNKLSSIRAQTRIGQVQRPGSESFLETEAPYKPPITEHQIEESQSTARKAKETTLARYFVKNKTDLTNIPKTSEYLQSVGNEAGLKRTPSLRTLENAIKMANKLRGSERGSLSLRDLKVDNPTANSL